MAVKTPGRRFASALFGLAIVVATPVAAQPIAPESCSADAAPPPLGVNRTNLAWAEHFETILAKMRAEGVGDVRLTLDPPFDDAIATVGVATSLDLGVLLNVPLWHKEFVVDGARQREGDPARGMYPIHRLSDLDVDRYERRLGDILATIERIGGRIKAFEIGNEIDWADFNGDLPLSRPGRRLTLQSFATAPEAPLVEAGFRNYAAALDATRRVLKASRFHRDTPIVSAGLADWGEVPEIGTMMSRELTQALFEKFGVPARVDAFATHVYPPAKGSDPARRFAGILASVDRATRLCGADKPCWITEWGFPAEGDGCRLDDRPRLALMRDFQRAAACLRGPRHLAATYLYDWDHGGHFSVWRCGRLLEAGRILARP